jgi:hypothetical protein
MPEVAATREAVVGGSQSEADQGKSMRPYLKKKPKSSQNMTHEGNHLKHNALIIIPSVACVYMCTCIYVYP